MQLGNVPECQQQYRIDNNKSRSNNSSIYIYRKTKARTHCRRQPLSLSSSTVSSFFKLMKLFKCMVREFELCSVVDQLWELLLQCPMRIWILMRHTVIRCVPFGFSLVLLVSYFHIHILCTYANTMLSLASHHQPESFYICQRAKEKKMRPN